MKLPLRIAVPVVAATATAATLLFVLWSQLNSSAEAIQKRITSGQNTSGPALPIPDDVTDTDDRVLIHLRQGDLLALQGEWAAAQAEYDASVREGGGIPALRKLAQAQMQRRDLDGVKTTIQALKNQGARDEDLLLLQVIAQLRTGEMVQARTLLENAVDSPQKHYGLALLAIVRGDHEVAKTELQTVMTGWDPTLRAYARMLQSAYDEFAVFPESKPIHLTTLMARTLAQVQECELALPLLIDVLGEQDDYRDAWIVQGYCQLTTERVDDAKKSLERAYQIDPQKPEIQYFLARTFSKLGDHQAAITYLQYAIENGFSPAAEARRLLAAEALATGDAELALKQLEELTLAEGASTEAYADFVAAALSMEKKEEAYAKAQAAVAAHPDDGSAHALLGWTAVETGRKDEAKTELMKALELDPSLKDARARLNSL